MRAVGVPAVLAAVVIGAFGAGPAHAAEKHHVVYEVWGNGGSASLVYFDGSNTLKDSAEVRMPAKVEVDNDSADPSYEITAQTNGKGEISCRITVDGVVKDTQTAGGDATVVSCSAV